jgi:GNAT superfamily N-acetyltransferase
VCGNPADYFIPMQKIRIAESDDDIRRCFPVMLHLRPHLKEDEFVPRVRSMHPNGFVLAFVEDEGEVRAVAGYRYLDMLLAGLTLYVDDLVTDPQQRSRGHGAALLKWLKDEARARGCSTLTLDSGVHREDAHRFYFRERMKIIGYHFSIALD